MLLALKRTCCSKHVPVMFYKVPFSAVPDLVARRQVLIREGCAYVGEAQVRGRSKKGC